MRLRKQNAWCVTNPGVRDGLDHNQLGVFLRARRAGLTPSDVGLPDAGSTRRVPGLRREEVADLAGISVDYYTRLEQGRVGASASVLVALESALRLDEDHLAYLYEVAGKTVARPRRPQPQRVRPAMQRLLNQIVDVPAIVLGRRLDILAWNPLAAALYMDFSKVPAEHRNYVRMFFFDARMRSLHADWEYAARACVATLRSQAAGHADDPTLASLVGELSLRSDRFRQLWASPSGDKGAWRPECVPPPDHRRRSSRLRCVDGSERSRPMDHGH